METVLFFKLSAAPPQEYTDLEKYFSESGNNTELTETYRSCLAKGELLACKINHDQVSAEQKLGLTKVRPYLFLMLINPIAPTLTVPNRTVIPVYKEVTCVCIFDLVVFLFHLYSHLKLLNLPIVESQIHSL